MIELEADRFQNLHYERPEFQTEAGAVYGEYRKDQTEPAFMLEEKLRDTAFDRHTYKHTTMGFEADVKNMPQGYEYSQTFFQRFYRPENVVLLVVGDFDPAAALKLIEEYYGPWKPGYKPADIKPEPAQTGERQGRSHLPRPDPADPRPGLSRRCVRPRQSRLRGRPALGRVGVRLDQRCL